MEKTTIFSPSARSDHATRLAYLMTCILRAPFWALYNLLMFILYKDLGASPFQIALFIAIRPIVSIFSMYWSAPIVGRPDRLRKNIVLAGVVGYLPFFFFPLIRSPWFVLFASGVYMTTFRGSVPAWMEVFKRNLPHEMRNKVFSWGSMISYSIVAGLPLVLGPMLDRFSFSWCWLFPLSAFLGLLPILYQLRMPIDGSMEQSAPRLSLSKRVTNPWSNAWQLFRSRADFRCYQIGFMLFGGCGLMIIQPALPKFFMDILGLSYTELSIALAMCKGVGFALTSPLWARAMSRVNLFRFSSVVTFFGGVFPLILLVAQWQIGWVYVAYLFYGVMQAGSELIWHLAGPLFADREDSSVYSNVSILIVGLRGCCIPQFGSFLSIWFASPIILLLGTLSCFIGMGWMLLVGPKLRPLRVASKRTAIG